MTQTKKQRIQTYLFEGKVVRGYKGPGSTYFIAMEDITAIGGWQANWEPEELDTWKVETVNRLGKEATLTLVTLRQAFNFIDEAEEERNGEERSLGYVKLTQWLTHRFVR